MRFKHFSPFRHKSLLASERLVTMDCVPPCSHSLLQQAVQSLGDDLRWLKEGVMKRQDPERNDPGDSSAVSDSMEIKHQSTKTIKKKKGMTETLTSNFRSPNTGKTEVTMHTTSEYK